MKEEIKKLYKVVGIEKETPTVTTIRFANDSDITYIPGQFINIYFPEFGNEEGKSYSISSSPDEKTINITVRCIGNFSKRLSNLKINDLVTASMPYGYFYTENVDSNLVFIAGGIGIAPFRSMIRDFLLKNPKREIELHYSNQSTEEIIFKKELDDLSNKFPNFSIKYYITRQNNSDFVNRRISIIDISKSKNAEYLLCGSIAFVRDFWRIIKRVGIDENNIYTESFF